MNINNKTVKILGTKYTIKTDEELENMDGYCDPSIKLIRICKGLFEESKPNEKADKLQYAREVVRHEIIHAFRNESGLQGSAVQNEEQTVDWFAIQFYKIAKVFEKLGVSE